MSIKPSNAVLIQGQSGQLCLVDSSGQLAVNAAITVGAVSVSGETVAIWQGSGRNGVFITNQSGTLFTVVDASGRLAITASGDVYRSQISGDSIAIWPASGRNAVYLTNQAGTSGVYTTIPADNIGNSNLVGLTTIAVNLGWDETSARWDRLRVTASGSVASNSGVYHRLLTDSTMQGSNFKTGPFVPAPDLSGGTSLTTNGGITPYGIKVKNYSGEVNSAIHVGSSGNPPYESGGWIIDIGDELHINVNQPDFVRIYARTSGASVCWTGLDF